MSLNASLVLTERKCVYQQFPYTQIALLQCDHNKDWGDTHLLRSLFSCSEKNGREFQRFEENICELHKRGSIVATSVCCVICCGLYSSNVLQPSSNRSVGTAEETDSAQVGAGCGYSDIIELKLAETGKARGSSS